MSHKEEQRKRSLALLRGKQAKAKRTAEHEANRLARLKRKEHVKSCKDEDDTKAEGVSMRSKASEESSTGK